MKQYLNVLKDVLENGTIVNGDRSGVGTISSIGLSEKYNLLHGELPFLTTRKLNFEKTLKELIWFISGSDNVNYLQENNIPFWDKWTEPNSNSIGPMYPVIWRNFPVVSTIETRIGNTYDSIKYIDQLKDLVESIESNPFSRRHYLSNINLGKRPDESFTPIENVENGHMALDTCHQVFYVSVREMTEDEIESAKVYRERQSNYFKVEDNREVPKYKLDTMLVMRSNDMMVGKPHNIAQYSMLTFMLAHILNMHPGSYTHSVFDSHIYSTHVEAAKELITREPTLLPEFFISPDLTKDKFLDKKDYLDSNLFALVGYNPQPYIKLALEG